MFNDNLDAGFDESFSVVNWCDDYYEPNVLNRVLEIFKELPQPSLLVGNCNIWADDGHLLFVNKPKKLKFIDLLLGPDANPFPLNPSAYFYHIYLHQSIGSYNIDEHYTMDVDFLLRAVQVATVKYVDETWGNYRQIEGTKTVSDIENGQSSRRVECLMKTYRKNLPLFQRWLVTIGYDFYKAVDWSRFKYFLDEPQNLLPVFKNKLKKILYTQA